MSITDKLYCLDCKHKIWIGQGGRVYTGEPQTMLALGAFLERHTDHTLVFGSEFKFEDECDDWTDVPATAEEVNKAGPRQEHLDNPDW